MTVQTTRSKSGLLEIARKGVAVECIIVIRCPNTLKDLGVWTGEMTLDFVDWDTFLETPKVLARPALSTDPDHAFVFPDIAQAYSWTYRLWTGRRYSAPSLTYAVRRRGDFHIGQNINRGLSDPWPKGPRYRMEAQT